MDGGCLSTWLGGHEIPARELRMLQLASTAKGLLRQRREIRQLLGPPTPTPSTTPASGVRKGIQRNP